MAQIIKVSDNNWAFRITYLDKYKQRKEKYVSGFSTKEDAETNATLTKNELQIPKVIKIKFNELANLYLQDLEKYGSPKTAYNTKFVINALNKNFGKMNADIIDSELVQHFVDLWNEEVSEKTKSLLSYETKLKRYKTLQSILNFGVYQNKIFINRVKRVKISKTKKFVSTTLTIEQTNTLLSELKTKCFDCYFPTLLLVYYGLRPEEALGLTKDIVDLNNNQFTINKVLLYVKKKLELYPITKTPLSERTLPMTDFIKKEFLIHLDLIEDFNQPFICISPLTGSLVSPQKLYRSVKKINKDTNKINSRLYDLRHTFSQISQENGTELEVVSKIMGHSNQYMTSSTYTRLQKDKTINAIDKLNKLLNCDKIAWE